MTMTEEKTPLEMGSAPYGIIIKQKKDGLTVEVYRERVRQGQRETEKLGTIPPSAHSAVRGLVHHALKDGGHGEGATAEGSYGLSREWGVRLAVVALCCHRLNASWDIRRAADTAMEAESTECQWWVAVMMREGEPGLRARRCYRIMNGISN